MEYDLPDTAILYADSARGIYIPQHFAESIKRDSVTGVSEEDWVILETGPDHEWYWDTWSDVEDSAIVTDPESGTVYRLMQDGDLWLVPDNWDHEESSE